MQRKTTDHIEIQTWCEQHHAKPALIDHPQAQADEVGIRLNFPGRDDEALLSSSGTLRNISWKDFFRVFDEEQLAFVYDEKPISDDVTQWYHFENRNHHTS